MSQVSSQLILQNDKSEKDDYTLFLKQSLLGSIQESKINIFEKQMDGVKKSHGFLEMAKCNFCVQIDEFRGLEYKRLKNSHWFR